MKFVLIGLFSLTFLSSLIGKTVGPPGKTVVRGKISDKNGETLIRVTVYLKNNIGVGVATDLDGNYSLTIQDNKPQAVIVSYIGYKTIEDTLNLNQPLLIKNFVMEPEVSDIKEVVVYSTINRGSD